MKKSCLKCEWFRSYLCSTCFDKRRWRRKVSKGWVVYFAVLLVVIAIVYILFMRG